jgi:aminoglycoside 3-N-acetyltransferase
LKRTSRAELSELLRALGLRAGDRAFVHAFSASLGLVECGLAGMHAAFRDVLGPDGTLVVPAFTSSYRRGEVYDVAASRSFNGAFSEYVRRIPGAARSLDPLFSFAAEGAEAQMLLQRPGPNCFGQGSGYEVLFAAGVKFVGLGIHWDQGYSFMMHLEREAGVPYRFEKAYEGVTRLGDGNEIHDRAIHFQRDEALSVRRNRTPLGRALVDEGIATERTWHGIVHRCMAAGPVAERVVAALRADPWCMTRPA